MQERHPHFRCARAFPKCSLCLLEPKRFLRQPHPSTFNFLSCLHLFNHPSLLSFHKSHHFIYAWSGSDVTITILLDFCALRFNRSCKPYIFIRSLFSFCRASYLYQRFRITEILEIWQVFKLRSSGEFRIVYTVVKLTRFPTGRWELQHSACVYVILSWFSSANKSQNSLPYRI